MKGVLTMADSVQKYDVHANQIGGWFFLSSRRRHTSYIGDWSSDVCSSDLEAAQRLNIKEAQGRMAKWVEEKLAERLQDRKSVV